MAKIFAAVIYFDDGPELFRECLTRLLQCNFDGIICVDGAFKEFPLADGQRFISTDGCTELAREMGCRVYVPQSPWDSQMEKRNKYIDITPEGDYFFVIDTDEFIEPGKIVKDSMVEDYYSVCMRVGILEPEKRLWDNPGTPIRCFKKFPDLQYKNRHCYLYRTSKITDFVSEYSGMYPDVHSCDNFLYYEDGEGVVFTHHPGLRPLARLAQDGQFLRQRSEIRLADRNLRENQDLWAGKIIEPPRDATGINRWVKVRYLLTIPYSGHLTDRAEVFKEFDVPWWRWLQLRRDYGPRAWKLLYDPDNPNPDQK